MALGGLVLQLLGLLYLLFSLVLGTTASCVTSTVARLASSRAVVFGVEVCGDLILM